MQLSDSLAVKLLTLIETVRRDNPAIAQHPRFRTITERVAMRDFALSRTAETAVAETLLDLAGADTAVRLAVAAGAAFKPGLVGPWGLALLSSATVGDAIRLGSHYLEASPLNLCCSVIESDSEVSMEVWDDRDLGPARDVISAFDLAAGWTFTKALAGDELEARHIVLAIPGDQDDRTLKRTFGPLCNYDRTGKARRSSFVFAESWMRKTLALSNPLVSQMYVAECERLLGTISGDSSLSAVLREILAEKPDFQWSAKIAAEALCISERTLRRRLENEGTSFRQVAQDVRAAIARELLANTTLTLEKVAGRVGFGEASNFSVAFKRWTGQTPREFRDSGTH